MPARQEQRIKVYRSNFAVGDRPLERITLLHVQIRAASVGIGLQKRRKDAKPLAGHHFWIGASCAAGWCGEHDVMPVIAHCAPWDAAFRRIEVAVRQRHEQGRHAIFRVSAEISEKHIVPFAVYRQRNNVRQPPFRSAPKT